MFSKLVFDNENEKEEFDKYIKIRGKYQYKQIYDVLNSVADCDVKYSHISSCIRYDKNLRDTLYVYLATFEEQLRTKIFDKYDINKDFSFKHTKGDFVDKMAKNIVVNNDNDRSILYEKFNLDLGDTISLVKKLSFLDDKKCQEFDSIRILRNRVMHHNVLVLGHAKTYEEMLKNKRYIAKLILDLSNNLPEGYRDNFLKALSEIKCIFADYKILLEV